MRETGTDEGGNQPGGVNLGTPYSDCGPPVLLPSLRVAWVGAAGAVEAAFSVLGAWEAACSTAAHILLPSGVESSLTKREFILIRFPN